MTITLFHVPPSLVPLSCSSQARLCNKFNKPSCSTLTCSPSSKLFVTFCSPPSPSPSPSTSTPVVEEDVPASQDVPFQSEYAAIQSSGAGCKACGREEVEKGCNGEGSIQGGIATVPGFGWWPIKAYRPCPGFVASGGRYRRQGQSMDEVAFGRGPPPSPSPSSSNTSSKKQDSKKSKR